MRYLNSERESDMDGLRVGAAGSAAVEGIHVLRAELCGHLSQQLCHVSSAL